MSEIESRVVDAWKKAADELGFRFTSPFSVSTSDGQRFDYLGLVHQFGGRIGMLIRFWDRSRGSSRPSHYKADGDYGHSELAEIYTCYERQLFTDTLEDWHWFGPAADRPSWYSGES